MRSIGERRDAEKKEAREGARYMKWETDRMLSKGKSDYRLRKPVSGDREKLLIFL